MTTIANITATTTVKTSAGRIKNFSVVVAGTASGSINDAASTGAAAAANAYVGLPTSVGALSFGPGGWFFATGIVVVPGAGQTIAIEYE